MSSNFSFFLWRYEMWASAAMKQAIGLTTSNQLLTLYPQLMGTGNSRTLNLGASGQRIMYAVGRPDSLTSLSVDGRITQQQGHQRWACPL